MIVWSWCLKAWSYYKRDTGNKHLTFCCVFLLHTNIKGQHFYSVNILILLLLYSALTREIYHKNVYQKNCQVFLVQVSAQLLHMVACYLIASVCFFSLNQPWRFYPYTRIGYQSNWWKNHRCLLHEWRQSVSDIILLSQTSLLILIVFNT